MNKETVVWYDFRKKIPKEMHGTFTKVMIVRDAGGEYALLDDTKPDRRRVFLDCNGIHGSTLVEDLNDIKFIAFRPKGPKKESEKTP